MAVAKVCIVNKLVLQNVKCCTVKSHSIGGGPKMTESYLLRGDSTLPLSCFLSLPVVLVSLGLSAKGNVNW